MSCCGGHRPGPGDGRVGSPAGGAGRPRDPFASARHGAEVGHRPKVRFRYVGRTGLTVRGGGTGRRYRFSRPGAVVAVDRRDRPSLRRVPVLHEVG
jgi:hypothetical protein